MKTPHSTRSNSHKPPSTDGFKKTKSQRSKGGKRGRPQGHKGESRLQTATPDIVLEHNPVKCSQCDHTVVELKHERREKRQVIEVKFSSEIIEHQRVSGKCPICGEHLNGSFPEGINCISSIKKGPPKHGEFRHFRPLN